MTATERIAQIQASLERARTAVADGSKLDLAGLSTAVEAAMSDALAAPQDDGAALAAALAELLGELDRVIASLSRQHHGEAQRRAAAAYGVKSGLKGDGS